MPNSRAAAPFPARLRSASALLALLVGAGTGSACTVGATPTVGPAATPEPEATSDPNALTWALSNAPETLDPSRMGVDDGAAQVSAQVYDRLLGVVERPDGSLGLSGGIAESWESDVSGRTYTFILRPGLTFHDGTALDAPAVKWNIERWMDPDHEGHDGIFRGWRAMFGGYVGENDASDRPRNLVERVEALDPLTVRITLRAPFAPLPHHLATAPFGIASPNAVRAQGADYGRDGDHLPVGSGPFRVVAWNKPAGAVRLERFAAHWPPVAEAPGIEFRAIPEPEARAAAVASGAVGGADLPASFPLTGTLAAPGVRALPRPARATAWLVLNVSRTPLDDVRVREAMSLALDREALAAQHFGAFALPAGALLPPGFAGYDASVSPPRQDLARARALLAEAGASDGFRLNVWLPTLARPYLPDPEGTGEAVAAMLNEIGIDAVAEAEPMRRLLERRTSGRGTAWVLGWEAQSLDPDNLWYWHFSPSRAPAEGQYVNASLGTLLLDAQQSIVPDARERNYRAAAQEVARDVPRLFLAHARPFVAVERAIAGFAPGPLGFDDFRAVRRAGPAPTTAPGALGTAPPADVLPGTGTATGPGASATEATPGVSIPATDAPSPAPP